MTFLSLLAALLLDLYVILPVRSKLDHLLHGYADFVRHHLDGGEHRLGLAAWLAVTIPILLIAGLIFGLLYYFSPVLGWLFNVAVLFCLIHFKRNADRMTAMGHDLRNDDLANARVTLASWRGMPEPGGLPGGDRKSVV